MTAEPRASRNDFASGRPPVAVILGGPSAEHDVSVVSGNAIAASLVRSGFAVQRVLIDLRGGWWWLPGADDATAPGGHDLPLQAYDEAAALGAEGPFSPATAVELLRLADPQPVAFIALHGPFGEDGTIQALFEAADLPYTGAGVAASALGMDKVLFKRLARGAGLPVIDWREVTASGWAGDRPGVLADLAMFASAEGDERLMVKPARLGSSVGITLAHTAAEREAALDLAFGYDTLAVVERYLAGARDLEVAVIGNDPATIEPYGPGEIFSGHEFYDYAAKYAPGVSRTTVRADLPEPLRAAIRNLAADAYRLIGAEGFARVDFLLAADNLVVSEINTIPGFTPISLFPTMPSEVGMDFDAVTRRVLELGIERHAARVRRTLEPADLPR